VVPPRRRRAPPGTVPVPSRVVGTVPRVRPLLAAGMASVCLFSTSAARAVSPDYVDGIDKDGQRVVFRDDPMSAGDNDPNVGRVTVRPTAAHITLLRPRVHFVREMLKSVENL
jgi:hypothetical protein